MWLYFGGLGVPPLSNYAIFRVWLGRGRHIERCRDLTPPMG